MTPLLENSMLVCPSCGYGIPTSDGYCLNCTPPDLDDDWTEDNNEEDQCEA
jgi:RNA polymerase subunit RPABC4/transcription elongation factor Spt4